MEMLTLIIALSTIMWYIIDRLKTQIWEELPYGKWITMGIAAAAGFALSFAFGLDIIFACGFVEAPTIAGEIITGFTLMSGSSAISEIIEKIKSK